MAIEVQLFKISYDIDFVSFIQYYRFWKVPLLRRMKTLPLKLELCFLPLTQKPHSVQNSQLEKS